MREKRRRPHIERAVIRDVAEAAAPVLQAAGWSGLCLIRLESPSV